LAQKILPFASKPLPNEILSSWLVRIAKNHFLEPRKFTSVFFKDKYFWTLDVDKSISGSYLDKLVQSTSVSDMDINYLTLKSFIPYLDVKFSTDQSRTWFNRIQRTKGRISSFSYLYCPNCLRTDPEPYLRKEWRIYLSTTCFKCECFLRENCPHCKNPIQHFNHNSHQLDKSFDYIKFCAVCKKDISDVEMVKAPSNYIENQKYIYELLYNGYNTSFSYSHLYFDGLYQIFQSCLAPQNIQINNALINQYVIPEFQIKKMIEIPLNRRTIILNLCIDLTMNWPKNLLEFCKENQVRYFEFIRKKRDYPYWYYSEIRKNLFLGNPTKKVGNRYQKI